MFSTGHSVQCPVSNPPPPPAPQASAEGPFSPPPPRPSFRSVDEDWPGLSNDAVGEISPLSCFQEPDLKGHSQENASSV